MKGSYFTTNDICFTGIGNGSENELHCLRLVLPEAPAGTVPIGLFASVGIGLGVPTLFSENEDRKKQIERLVPAAAEGIGRHCKVSYDNPLEKRGKRPRKVKKGGSLLRIRIGNACIKRLLSGAVAGVVSRMAVAPLDTIQTHLIVGSSGKSMAEVFGRIMETEGWQGFFRGNATNIIRVAPSKAIELFAYDTVKKVLTPKRGEPPRIPLPISPVSGAFAGVCSTLCTYPLELLKTRMTVQRGVYRNLFHALMKIIREEGTLELYRGLAPSLIGVIPYSAANYFAYESLKKLYKHITKEDHIGNLAILLIGSAAGAISSTATFPLDVARKQMQMGALSGRQAYNSMFHALSSIIEHEGLPGLYRGLGPSCMKLVPAGGISFMCYEACGRLLIQEQNQ